MESSLTKDAKDWYVADFGGAEVPTGGGDDNDKSNGKKSRENATAASEIETSIPKPTWSLRLPYTDS